MLDDGLYVMTPAEIVWGYVPGLADPLPPPRDESATPRSALERVLAEALRRPPCGIAFSGGRDSSLLLALATHVARRDGLPEPVAMTNVFPNAPAADEGAWQEMVVRHIGLQEWCRIPVADELDLIGPRARVHLRAHGVVWPPTIHADGIFFDRLAGGSLVDGEGGDEVLGVAQHRIASVTAIVRSPRPLRWHRIHAATSAVAPTWVRARQLRRRWQAQPITWLRPAAREAFGHALGSLDAAAQPLSFAESVRLVPRRRAQQLLRHNRRVLGDRSDVDVSSPLLDPEVVHALARDGGRLGRGGRTTVLRHLVPDLLPDAVLARTSKADMRGGYMAGPTRAFAARWDGTGVDPGVVDPGELRRLWLAEGGASATGALLQAAWLAGERVMSG
jgi:asparagine synthase (glutamine-hydrolysing)